MYPNEVGVRISLNPWWANLSVDCRIEDPGATMFDGCAISYYRDYFNISRVNEHPEETYAERRAEHEGWDVPPLVKVHRNADSLLDRFLLDIQNGSTLDVTPADVLDCLHTKELWMLELFFRPGLVRPAYTYNTFASNIYDLMAKFKLRFAETLILDVVTLDIMKRLDEISALKFSEGKPALGMHPLSNVMQMSLTINPDKFVLGSVRELKPGVLKVLNIQNEELFDRYTDGYSDLCQLQLSSAPGSRPYSFEAFNVNEVLAAPQDIMTEEPDLLSWFPVLHREIERDEIWRRKR